MLPLTSFCLRSQRNLTKHDSNEKNKMLSTIKTIDQFDLINKDYINKKKIVQKMEFPLYLPINPDIPYTSIDYENI